MRDRQDLHPSVNLAEYDEEGEATQNVSTGVGEIEWPASRGFLDLRHCQVDLGHECFRRLGVAILVPLAGSTSLSDRLGMNPRFSGH